MAYGIHSSMQETQNKGFQDPLSGLPDSMCRFQPFFFCTPGIKKEKEKGLVYPPALFSTWTVQSRKKSGKCNLFLVILLCLVKVDSTNKGGGLNRQ